MAATTVSAAMSDGGHGGTRPPKIILEREGELLSLSSKNQKIKNKKNWKTVFKSLFIGWTKRHRFGQLRVCAWTRIRTRGPRKDPVDPLWLFHADRWGGTLTIVDSAYFDLNRLMHILWLWSDLTFSTAIIRIFIRIDLVKILWTFCKFLFSLLLLLFNIYKYFIYKYILILL